MANWGGMDGDTYFKLLACLGVLAIPCLLALVLNKLEKLRAVRENLILCPYQ